MPDDLARGDGWISVARLGKCRGLKGEIFGDVWNPPESYRWLKRVWIRNCEGEFLFQGSPLEVLEARPLRGRLVLRFSGIETRDAAQALTGCEAVVPREELPPLPDGEYYLSDLLGCAVIDRRTGAPAGTVAGWQDFGGALLLEMTPGEDAGGGPVWIPFTRAICVEIRPEERRIVIDPPEGLLELNRLEKAENEPGDDLSRADHFPGILPRPVRARRRRPRPRRGPARHPHP
ncbi:MAG: ribosome maturation factor RimM [Bryobacteraceae bacterium]